MCVIRIYKLQDWEVVGSNLNSDVIVNSEL